MIREKLKPDHPEHYTDLRQVMTDIRLMFKNAFTYNPVSRSRFLTLSFCHFFPLIHLCFFQVDSQVYQEARNLEEFFEKLLLKWASSHAYDDPFLTPNKDEDEEVFPPNKKYRRIISD